MPAVRSYQDLIVWQKSMALAAECYERTRAETYGMTSQIRRSAASIPANIAEGNGRESTKVYIQLLRIAQGSLEELETHVLLAQTAKLMDQANKEILIDRCDEIGRLLRASIRSLQERKERNDTE